MNPASWGTAPLDGCTATSPGDVGPDRISRNSYDVADQLLKIEKAVGTPIQQPYATYEHDLGGRQTAATTNMDGTARTIGSVYDPEGNRTHVGAATGYGMNFAYDGTDRMKRLFDNNNETIVQLVYDSAGRRQSLALGPGGSSAA